MSYYDGLHQRSPAGDYMGYDYYTSVYGRQHSPRNYNDFKLDPIHIPMTYNTRIMRPRRYVKWSWKSTVCSLLTCWFLFPPLGAVGLLYSVLAYADHKAADYPRSDHKERLAWGFCIAGVVLGIIMWTIIVVCLAIFYYDINPSISP